MATDEVLKHILKELREIKSDYKNFRDQQEQQGLEFRAIFDELKKENSALKKTVHSLVVKNNKLETEVSMLTTGLNSLIQDKLAKNLIITGIPVTEGEDLIKLMITIGLLLKVDISDAKFRVRRLFSKKGGKYVNLLVEFDDIQLKTELLKQRKQLPLLVSQLGLLSETEKQIFFFHHLTSTYLNLLSEARKLKDSHKLRYIWYQNNQVLIKRENCSKIFAVKSLMDLHGLQNLISSEKKLERSEVIVGSNDVIDVDALESFKTGTRKK